MSETTYISDELVMEGTLDSSGSAVVVAGRFKGELRAKDVLLEDLPDSFDLIIIRDLFIHLKNDEILKIINKINSSTAKFLAVTSYPSSEINTNSNRFGHHRYINMKLDPFYLDRPFKIFDDNENQHNPRKLYIYKINEKS